MATWRTMADATPRNGSATTDGFWDRSIAIRRAMCVDNFRRAAERDESSARGRCGVR